MYLVDGGVTKSTTQTATPVVAHVIARVVERKEGQSMEKNKKEEAY